MDGTSNDAGTRFSRLYITPQERAFAQLEAQITELWGHLNAATYRFLMLVAEFDRKGGPGWHGLANTAQWLNWQCGIGRVAAREKVRVALALEALPQISASFEKGEISYSKVRAMTRVATAATESVLLNVALHGTAAHVEKLVRKYRWCERRDAAEAANDQHVGRYLNYFYDDAGSMIIQAKLPPEVGALVKKALDAAAEALREQSAAEGRCQTESNVSAETFSLEQEENTAGARRADALRHLAESFLDTASEQTGSSGDRYQIVVHVDQAVLPQSGDATDDAPHRCELEDGPVLALETVRRLGCDGSLVGVVEDQDGEPLNIGRKTRSIPPALKRALSSRDGGCRFPGCDRTRFTEGHHVKHWADGGETKLSNLIILCRFHHRLIHEGGFGLSATDDGVFVFTRPDGRRIAERGECFRGNISSESPRRARDASFEETLELYRLNLEQGLTIDKTTSRTRWVGETLDYNTAIEGMQFLRDQAAMRDAVS